MTYTSYLFDFDGTLVDSMPTFVSVMLRILEEHGIPYGKEIVKIITPLGYGGTARYYRELGIQKSEEELRAMMDAYAREEYLYRIPAKEHVIPVLRKLKEAGADLNVLTASPHSVLDPCLKRLGIYPLFTHVWSCDDFATTKADPAIYRQAAERMGCELSRVLFLDDNLNADKTAREAGMKVCGVYDASSADYTEEIRSACHHYIESFAKLLEL